MIIVIKTRTKESGFCDCQWNNYQVNLELHGELENTHAHTTSVSYPTWAPCGITEKNPRMLASAFYTMGRQGETPSCMVLTARPGVPPTPLNHPSELHFQCTTLKDEAVSSPCQRADRPPLSMDVVMSQGSSVFLSHNQLYLPTSPQRIQVWEPMLCEAK